MPQQINLSTPVLLAEKRYFSAQTMLVSLSVFLLLGGALTVYGLWSLRAAGQAMQAALSTQEPELLRLRAAVAQGKVVDQAGDQALAQQLQAAQKRLQERQAILAELQQGLVAPGRGHSLRLQLVAQSIPPQAWVTTLAGDANRLEVSGFTEEPAVLNDWLASLARSPVLAGQALAKVKVERAPGATPGARPVWAFLLGSVTPTAEVAR